MSRLKCCVAGCFASGNADPILHIFPNPVKDKDRFNSWIFAIGGEIIGLDNEFIFQQRRVCHAHFENKFHCRNNRLSNNAIPTLNLREPPRLLPKENPPFRPVYSSDEPIPSTSKVSDFGTKLQYMDKEKKESIISTHIPTC
ncbi:uncharacterized protein LOC128672627 [Plodia interpunctella]|uniref:uncharacterized protein LOC128672627 n=1 Tax=Plodia interpunctella TaxID=58824 RepID=UPI0023686C7A|nr:uncharacterized protein LOC128672627 isoform X2 [Plodia interpunctella]